MRVTAAVVEQLDAPFTIEQLELDEPGPGEALVRVVATGICHTDAITVQGDLPMPFGVRPRVGDGPADFSLECTGVIAVVRQAVDSVGMLGTCILIGGAPARAEFAVDHVTTLWGKRIVGTLGGSGRSQPLIGTLVDLHARGGFRFDRLVGFYELTEIADALADSRTGAVLKPVLRMPSAADH